MYKHNPELKNNLDRAIDVIPEKYCICGTCFTAFTLVGDASDGRFIHIIHKDKDNRDVVSIIFLFCLWVIM